MFARRFLLLNLIVHMIIAFSYVNVVYANQHCLRVPDGSGGKRSQSTNNFRIRLSDDSGVYKPGREYKGEHMFLFFIGIISYA